MLLGESPFSSGCHQNQFMLEKILIWKTFMH